MADTAVLSPASETKLRKAFGMLRSWTSGGLINRLMEEDIRVSSRNAAQHLVNAGYDSGLLVRRRNTANGFIYELNADFVPAQRAERRAAPESTRDPLARTDIAPAGSYAGPAFHSGPLMPHLGARALHGVDADGELLPCIGGRIAEQLGVQFRAEFME